LQKESVLMGGVQDSETKAVLSSVMSQISSIAERMEQGSTQLMSGEDRMIPDAMGNSGSTLKPPEVSQTLVDGALDVHSNFAGSVPEAANLSGLKELLSGDY
jgi:hypothetical protein